MRRGIIVWTITFAASAFLAGAATAANESVIYNFRKGTGAFGRFLEDSAGSIYSTAYYQRGQGTVYKLQEKQGVWHDQILHNFSSTNGRNPLAGLVQDPVTGSYYGSARYGGGSGYGTLFSLTQTQSGWTFEKIHDFVDLDGQQPAATLYRDRATNILYGTASAGGNADCGTVFSFDPSNSKFTSLYNFAGGSDGCLPTTQLRPGPKAGTLLGSTTAGGTSNGGTIYQLQETRGVWKESVVHSFSGGSDGAAPSDLEVADDGTLYGAAMKGGTAGHGVIFAMTRPGKNWTYNVIYTFSGGDGAYPVGLNLDEKTSTLFGTTQSGGANQQGTVFKLTANGSNWTETVVHSFAGGTDGSSPNMRPSLDSTTGIIYGTTILGGARNGGVVYQITP